MPLDKQFSILRREIGISLSMYATRRALHLAVTTYKTTYVTLHTSTDKLLYLPLYNLYDSNSAANSLPQVSNLKIDFPIFRDTGAW